MTVSSWKTQAGMYSRRHSGLLSYLRRGRVTSRGSVDRTILSVDRPLTGIWF
jgi:formylmethanofuran dehydrogenase subunit B